MARKLSTLSSLIFPFALVACSAGGGGTDAGTGGDAATGGGNAAGAGTPGTGGTTSSNMGGSTGDFMNLGGNTTTGCVSGPDEDKDMDGFTVNAGDCNDCDANVNPGSIEVIPPTNAPNCLADGTACTTGAECCSSTCDANTSTCVAYVPADEDCDGTVDNPPQPCDSALTLDSTDPMDGARAIDLCKQATGMNDWGVVSAQYVRANGTPTTANLQVGIEPSWGPNVSPQLGGRMLVLSSGHARTSSDPGSCNAFSCTTNGTGTPPAGFPQDVPNCSGGTAINDDVGLDLTIRAPKNATGYKFNFDFYSFEYPEWVCTTFNDQFIALVNPPPMGSINGNVSFDSQGNPVSVNIAFFNVCSGCALGTNELAGTGFDVWDDAGATSWLQTQAPITGGETFNIRYAIWDTGDTAWDSTALIDSFEWIANGGTVTVGTTPDIPQ